MSINIGWDGGVFATTCGHYLHLDCQHSYIETLKVRIMNNSTLTC